MGIIIILSVEHTKNKNSMESFTPIYVATNALQLAYANLE